MKRILLITTILEMAMLTACSPQTGTPVIIEGKLLVPAGQTLVIPAGGLLFSNGLPTGGVQ
jgi:hypothetical protein